MLHVPLGLASTRDAGRTGDALRSPVAFSHRVGEHAYDVRVARSAAEWRTLEPFWNALLDASPAASGFQTCAYLRAWWRCFGSGKQLHILSFWRGDQLRGIAPLQTETRRTWLGPRRELGFIGTAPFHATAFISRPGFLFGSDAAACTAVLLEYLARGDLRWDRIELHEQPTDPASAAALREAAEHNRWLFWTLPDVTSAYIAIDGAFDAFFAKRSHMHRGNVRSAKRKLEAQGELRFERVSGWPQAREALARYRELEARSWKRGHDASISGADRGAIYDALAEELGPDHGIQFCFLTLDGRTLAGTIAVVRGGHYYHLEITYDAEFRKYSPGVVLEYLELQEVFARGYREYDFLGGRLEHKARWTSTQRETLRLLVTPRSLSGALAYAWWIELRPRLKDWIVRSGLTEKALRLQALLKS